MGYIYGKHERLYRFPLFQFEIYQISKVRGGKNGKLDPLKTDEGDHLKFLLQKSVKLFIGNGV